MGKISLQIVFVVEADNKSKSDYMYIKSIMDKYYKPYLSTIKITPIYMGGIGNFGSKKTINAINRQIDQYKNGKTEVVYCYDTDNEKVAKDKIELNKRIEKYCADNNYHAVFFCRDIEEVFIKERVHNDKSKTAIQFLKNGCINNINVDSLKSNIKRNGTSNLLLVVDGILTDMKN